MTKYEERIVNRSFFAYWKGYIIRLRNHLYYSINCIIARKRGAVIGQSVVISRELAKMANKNLRIGDHSLIMTKQLDLRNPISFGSHVIIGASVKILTTSHCYNSSEFEVKNGGIIVEDYVWAPSMILVTPSCHHIGRGAVIGSGSCVVKNVEEMTVIGGNPAKFIKQRENVHDQLIVESLQGADYLEYRRVWKNRNKIDVR